VHAYLPAEAALKPNFSREIAQRFRLAAPLIEALNGAILEAERPRGMSFGPLF
jgi:hypothetical protein